MSLRSGQMVFERYRVDSVVTRDGLIQARCFDTAEKQWVQLIGLSAAGRLKPNATERFVSTCDLPAVPGTLPRQYLGLLNDSPLARRPAGVRQLPAGLRLNADDAWHCLLRLGPAIAETHEALDGAVTSDDLVIDADGEILLAPSGRIRTDSVSVLPHHLPPEAGTSTATDKSSALYGLGVFLFQSLTGEAPTGARSLPLLRAAQTSVPGLRRRRSDLTETLAAAIDGLLSAEPAQRIEVLGALPPPPEQVRPELTVSTVDRTPHRRSDPSPGKREPTQSRAEIALHGWMVVADLTKSTLAARRRLAALSGRNPDDIERALNGDELLVLHTQLRNQATADALRAELASSGVSLASVLVPDSPAGRRIAAIGLGGAGLLGMAGATGLLSLGAAFGLAAGLPAGALLVGALWLSRSAQRDLTLSKRLEVAVDRLRSSPPLDPITTRLMDARRAVLADHVPASMRVELESSIDDLHEMVGREGHDADAISAAAAEIIAAVNAPPVSSAVDRIDTATVRAKQAASALRTDAS